jgi:hypothetical protein
MAIVTPIESPIAFTIRGKYGFGRGRGGSQYGHARYGLSDEHAGIYSRKMYGTGVSLRPAKLGGRFAISRMKFYRPTNTQQENQQIWRGKFAEIIAAYQALSDDQRAILKRVAKQRGTSGYHLYISQSLQGMR